MRPIKFRAWNSAMNNMIAPEMLFINLESDHGTCSLAVTIESIQKNFELMQFTGLTDKNGKEIYEGDILYKKCVDKEEESGFSENWLEVSFKDGAFGWIGEITKKHFPFATEPISDYHIIGNIYENPELINL